MFGGSQQGGGGSQMTVLTGLWFTAKGNLSGVLTPDKFEGLFQLMQEAHKKNVGLVFAAVADKKPEGKKAGRLMVAVATPKNQAVSTPAPASAFSQPTAAAAPSAFAAATAPTNPPKDELDAALEEV